MNFCMHIVWPNSVNGVPVTFPCYAVSDLLLVVCGMGPSEVA